MKIEPITKVTMYCPACQAGGITLDLTKNDSESLDILAASESFVCPVCKQKFDGAPKLLESISEYNESAIILSRYQELFSIQLEQSGINP